MRIKRRVEVNATKKYVNYRIVKKKNNEKEKLKVIIFQQHKRKIHREK